MDRKTQKKVLNCCQSVHSKVFQSWFRSGQYCGHKRLPKIKFSEMPYFSGNVPLSETIIGMRPWKKTIDDSWTALYLNFHHNWPKVNSLGSWGKKSKAASRKNVFLAESSWIKIIYGKNELHRVSSLLETRRKICMLTLKTLKLKSDLGSRSCWVTWWTK